MGRYKIQILSVLCGALFMLQGCVHGTLDECPPMVQYAVAFTYTNHTGKTDRFYDDVKKINLYVFDENNLIYTTTTKLSPYETNFNIPLDIPMGKYHIIAWGNVLDDSEYSITPDDFVMGETTLDEARLILQQKIENVNGQNTSYTETELEKLFYGELDVDIPLYISRVDTIPLTNNTNRVRVVLHLDQSRVTGDEVAQYDKFVVRLEGTNAVYDFNNGNVPTNVTYKPFATYWSDSIMKSDKDTDWQSIYFYSDSVKKDSKTMVYDFTVLRLFKDIPMNLVIQYWEPTDDGFYIKNDVANVDIISRGSGFEYLFTSKGIAETNWQNTFDKYERYKVEMYIVQGSKYYDSFATGMIHITDWVLNQIEDGGGAN